MTAPSPLDPLAFPLHGSRLIEASAGTGKTYTIAALYLRLVLGHGGAAAYPRALVPPQILVVTFTDAATKELRDRIRARLAEAAEAFAADPAALPARRDGEDLLHDLRAAHPPAQWPGCARTLRLAAEWMDEAAVSTIHGWCQRMLREHAFDSGSLFEQTLQPSRRETLAAVVRDWWRLHGYPLPEAAARTLRRWWRGPDALLGDVDRLLDWAGQLPDDPEPVHTLVQAAEDVEARRPPWVAWAAELQGLFDQARERRQIHGNKLRQDWYTAWLAALGAWGRGEGEQPKLSDNAWQRLTTEGIAEAWKAGPPPAHPAFDAVAALRASLDALQSARARTLHHAVRWCAQRLAADNERHARLGFQDLLTRLDVALQGEGGERLAARIRAQFPVALIDEFQDTDPTQYRIFDRIYRVADDDRQTALVLIGDPKQAIYGFRGADIHTYLRARAATAGRHATLGTNHRSTKAMVRAVNRVFAQAEARPDGRGAFGFGRPGADNPLPFHEVGARGRDETWVVDGAEPAALTLWPVEPAQDFEDTMAALCAQQVVQLLRAGRQGQAGFRDRAGVLKPVTPADIAVLVDTGRQADAVRRALRRRGVRSVYLSEKASVFDSPVVDDLLRWLQACAAPQDERLRRAALATATLGLDWAALDRLNRDEAHAEQMAQRFLGYRQAWRRQGVLPMLRRLMHDFGVPARLLALQQERELTDLLHLSEWLQQTGAALDGEHALVRHLAAQRGDGVDGLADDLRRLRLESDAGLVKVVTVHKSKGLEYPLVLLPFVSHHREAKAGDLPLKWHEGQAGLRISAAGSADEAARADEERLAEDLRRLYVALTRARHATWVGVAHRKSLHRSAFGCLLAGGQEIAAGELRQRLQALQGGLDCIAVVDPTAPDAGRLDAAAAAPVWRAAPRPPAAPAAAWWVASYSGLMARAADAAGATDRGPGTGRDSFSPGLGAGTVAAPADSAEQEVYLQSAEEGAESGAGSGDTPAADTVPTLVTDGDTLPRRGAAPGPAGLLHDFPQGARAGSFLHGLLEWAGREGFDRVADDPAELDDLIARRCNLNGYARWIETLRRWMRVWLDTPWDLSPIAPGLAPVRPRELRRVQVELEFWLPVAGAEAGRIDALVTQHTLGGAARAPLGPQRLQGLLKGYVDLVFEHDGRFFVADHKSNRLGEADADYDVPAMRGAVLGHRYELQYALYLLALHRLLRARLGAGYHAAQQLGGAVYLFLRGHAAPGGGLHLERPPQLLVDELDQLFSGADGRPCREGVR